MASVPSSLGSAVQHALSDQQGLCRPYPVLSSSFVSALSVETFSLTRTPADRRYGVERPGWAGIWRTGPGWQALAGSISSVKSCSVVRGKAKGVFLKTEGERWL